VIFKQNIILKNVKQHYTQITCALILASKSIFYNFSSIFRWSPSFTIWI